MENNMGSLPKIERCVETKMGHVYLTFLLKHNTDLYINIRICKHTRSYMYTSMFYEQSLTDWAEKT